jgi:sugar lactone lactonase YvrE
MKTKIIFFLQFVIIFFALSCTKKGSPDQITYPVSTFAGSGRGYADGPASTAMFKEPASVAFDSKGNLYVADDVDNRIRKISPSGIVSTFAGSGIAGNANGMGETAQFNGPAGIAIDAQDNLYVGDSFNGRICKITPAGLVSTFAGGGGTGYKDGPASSALFNSILDICIDINGNLYVAEGSDNIIRKITPTGIVSTLAGFPSVGGGGYVDGVGTSALFNFPTGVAVDLQGNVYVSDYGNYRIRKVTPAGVVTTVAGTGSKGFVNGVASTAQFGGLDGIVTDVIGNIYVSDDNNYIRKITPAGVVSTFAGNGQQGRVNAGLLTSSFYDPLGLVFDAPANNMYVAEGGNYDIRKIKIQ